MELGSNLSESQENFSEQPELNNDSSTQEPIYKTKDGQTVTKSQLVNSGYSEERINKGVSNKVLSLVGDTNHHEQKFTTKDGQTVTTRQLLDSGYSQDRIDKGIHNGVLSPYIEKKKENFQPNGQTSQKVSPTHTETKKSLLDTEGPKMQSEWDSLDGKPKDVTLGGFKINKPVIGIKKQGKVVGIKKSQSIPNVDFDKMTVEELIDFQNNKEVTYQAPVLAAAFGGGVSKAKMTPELKPHFDNFINQNYKSAIEKTKGTSLNKDDLTQIDKDYEEAKNGGSWFDKIGAYTTSILSHISMEEDETGTRSKVKTPLEDLRAQVKQEAIDNGETLLPGQIEYRVKQKFTEERKKSILQSKINSAKENLTNAEQYAMGAHKASQSSHLSKENKDATDSLYNTITITKGLISSKQDLEKQAEDIKKQGGQITQDLVDKYNNTLNSIKENDNIIKSYQRKISQNQKDLGTFSQEAQAYTSENNELLDLVKRVQSYGYGFMGNVAEFASKYIDKPAGEVLSFMPGMQAAAKHFEEADKAYSEEYAKKSQEIKEGKEGIMKGVNLGGVTKTYDVNNVNDFVNSTVEMIGDNAGMTAALLMGGEVGLIATGVESAGGKAREIRVENQEFNKVKEDAINNNKKEFDFNGEKYNVNEYKDKDLHSSVASYVVPIAWGGAMAIPMVGQLKFLQNEARLMAAAEKESPKLIQQTLDKKAIDWSKKYIGHSLGLARDLKVMALAQATLDYSLGKKVDYFQVATDLKSVRDAFILHGMNAGFAHALGQTARPYMSNEEARVIDGNSKLMTDLDFRIKSKDTPKEEKAILRKQLNRLKLESQIHIDNVLDRMSDMSDADYSKVVELAKKSSELRNEAAEVQDSKLTDAEKQDHLDRIKKEYLLNEASLRDIKNNYTKKTDGFYGISERDKSKYEDKAKKELNGKEYSNRDLKIKAQEIWSRENTVKEEPVVEEPNTDKPKGVEDEISQPIELEVTPKKAEEVVTPIEEVKPEVEAKPTESKPTEEVKQTEIESAKPTKEAKPTEAKVKKTVEEINQEAKDESQVIQEKTDEFNSKNREYKGKSKKELERDLEDAEENEYQAKKRISSSENTDEAIKEYNDAKLKTQKVLDDIESFNNNKEISWLIYDAIDDSSKPDYEYKDLFKKDPRLAAIKQYQGLHDYLKEYEPSEKEQIDRYKDYVDKLKKDIKENPLKENTAFKAEAKTEAPKSRRKPKEKVEEETKHIVEAKTENSKVDLLGDRKAQWMNEVPLDELKAHRKGYSSQNIYSIEDALIPKKVRGKNRGSEFDRAIAEKRITPEEAVKIINSAGKEAPESITKLVKEVKSTEAPKVEEQKEIVSLPEEINEDNFDDIVNKLMESDKVTKPCD
jgi:hypothetical protein